MLYEDDRVHNDSVILGGKPEASESTCMSHLIEINLWTMQVAVTIFEELYEQFMNILCLGQLEIVTCILCGEQEKYRNHLTTLKTTCGAPLVFPFGMSVCLVARMKILQLSNMWYTNNMGPNSPYLSTVLSFPVPVPRESLSLFCPLQYW